MAKLLAHLERTAPEQYQAELPLGADHPFGMYQVYLPERATHPWSWILNGVNVRRPSLGEYTPRAVE